MLATANKLKWPMFMIAAVAVIGLAFLFSRETTLINETRTVQPPQALSSPTKSSISGTVNFDSTSTSSFDLQSPSKVHIDFQAGHYGVGAVITDITGRHLLDLSFSNILGANNPSGEFIGNPGTYNVTLSGPSSFAVSDVGKPVSYGLTLTTTEIVPITKSVRSWTKFYLISVPSLIILLFLVFLMPYLLTKRPQSPEPVLETYAPPTNMPPMPPHLPSSPEGKHWWVPPEGLPSDTPPPKSQQDIIKETRELAFKSLQSLLGFGLLKDAAAAAKFHESISKATSEEDLQEIVNTLGAFGAGQSFQPFEPKREDK